MGDLAVSELLPSVLFECEKSDLDLPYPFHLRWERRNKGYFSLGKLRRGDDHAIFHYCLSGRGCVRYRDRLCTVQPGSGFLGVIDEMDYFYPEDGVGDWSFFWFGFRGGNYRELTHWLVDRYGPVFQLPADDDFILKMQLLAGQGNTAFLNAGEAAALVLELLGTLKRQREKHDFLSMPGPVRKAVQMIRESKSVPRISEIADGLQISREHLSRLFQNTMKSTLHSYLEQQSSQLAKKLLLTSDLSVTEIAELCGYRSASSFIRMFQKKNHLSPQKFRVGAGLLYSSGWERHMEEKREGNGIGDFYEIAARGSDARGSAEK